eukprot:110496-Prymnesium_polylepis.1
MRQRLPTSADDDGEDKAPGGRADRTPLNEALSLGPLYGILNQVAPLVRLYAVGTLIAQSSKAAGGVLWPMIAAVVSGLATKPLQNLAGALVPGDKESSAFHQARLAASQLLRAALQAILGTLALALVDLDACGLRAGRAGLATELAAGAAAAATMCAVWSIVPRILGVDRCEGLTMAGGTHDLSGASEDELLRGMRPTMHTAHLLGRCVCLTFDVVRHRAASLFASRRDWYPALVLSRSRTLALSRSPTLLPRSEFLHARAGGGCAALLRLPRVGRARRRAALHEALHDRHARRTVCCRRVQLRLAGASRPPRATHATRGPPARRHSQRQSAQPASLHRHPHPRPASAHAARVDHVLTAC